MPAWLKSPTKAAAFGATLLGLLLVGAYLLDDGALLDAEPPPYTIPTGEVVLVDNGSCPWGQVLAVRGSMPGVPRMKDCRAYPLPKLLVAKAARLPAALSRLYDVLVVVGSVFAGLGVLALVARYFRGSHS